MSALGLIFSTGLVRAQWTSADIGAVGKAGSDSYNSTTGVYTLKGSGSDIWGNADAFHFVYQTLSNDGELVARVVSIPSTNSWAKSGVMVRQSNSPGSIQAMVVVTPGNGVAMQYRSTQGGSSVNLQTAGPVAPYWVKIVKDGNIVTTYVSPDGSTWTYLGNTELAFTGPVEIGLATCSHNNSTLGTATFDNISLNAVTSFAPSTPWVQQDIGATGLAGAVHSENDQWTVYASGADIWGTADAFHYTYQPLSGDGSIQVEVSALTPTNGWTKGGVMIRSDLTPGAANAFIAVTPANGITAQWRTTAGGNSSYTLGAKVVAPYWVKIVRSGNQFYYYQSADGITWKEITVQTIAMPHNVYVGVAQTSHNNNALAVGFYDSLQLQPTTIQANSFSDTSVDLIWPSLVDPSTVAQYAIYQNGVEIGTSTETNFEAIQLQPSTRYAFQAKALDANDNVLASTSVLNVTTAAAYLPSPWTHLDIGSVLLGGATVLDATTGTYMLTASGVDIWGQGDQFQFAEQSLTGDGQIIARVKSVSPTNSWTKAGIMLRETNAPGSKHVSLFLTPGNGVAFQYRNTTNGNSTNANFPATGPLWLKLIRKGTQVSAFRSSDGMAWTLVGSDTVTMNASLEAGLALTSHSADLLAGAMIDNVSIQSGLPTSTTPPTAPTNLTAVATGDVSATIQWTAATDPIGVTGYNIFRNGQLINTTTVTQFTDTGLSPAQSYNYTVQAIDFGGLTSSPSAVFNLVTAASQVGAPWAHQEIGALALAGTAVQSGTSFTLTASGNDIWNTMDAFGLVEQSLTGDGQITAEVNNLTKTNSWAKAGVMLRNSLDPGSAFVDVAVTPGQGIAFQYRSTLNGNCTNVLGPSVVAPYWVRLVRKGQVVQGLASPDGVNWTLLGQVTTTFGANGLAGLAVTSHQNGTLATANFSQVTVQASGTNPDSDGNGLPDAWEIQYFGHIGNDPNSLSPAGDGYTLLQEYQLGRNPLDYYQGATPVLSIVSGNNQSVQVNSFAASPLIVQMANAAGTVLPNAPITFSLAGSGGGLSGTNGGTPASSLALRANAQGLATVYLLTPGSVGTVAVTAAAGTAPHTAQVSFSEQVIAPPVVLGTLRAGGDNSFLSHADGTLKGWGNDLLGQLGLAPQASVPTPTLVAGAYVMVASRGGHTLFLHTDHTVSAVGENYFGQLGTGNHNDLTTPQTVAGLANIIGVATGAGHSLALQQDGTVLSWGGNWAGQLGSGTTTDALAPSSVTGLSNITALSAGRAHSLALAQDGTVYAWGDNSYGQLGTGNRTNVSTPTPVSGLSQIVAISAGDYFSVALQKSGTVYVWGANSAGQLALGHQHVVLTPQAIGSFGTGKALATGAEHLVVLDSSGNVSASGANFSGQLGTGDNLSYNILKTILTGGVAQIAAGFDHTLALKTDGTIQGWGANQAGQIGDSTVVNKNTPTLIGAP